MSSDEASGGARGFDLSRTIRKIVLLGFALIQLVLVARILQDLGVIPADGVVGDPIIRASDALAAPVRGIGNALPPFLTGAIGGFPTAGLNVAMIAALAGWTVVEALVMRVVKKFDAI
jgi:hypothetical protein